MRHGTFISIFAVVCAGGSGSAWSNDACGTGGDCFEPGGGPGCADVVCCELVCRVDSFCCSVAWDAICVAEAASTCEFECPPFSCEGSPEAEPCGVQLNGGPAVLPPRVSDCCKDLGAPGCDDSGCEGLVCTIDNDCCEDEWDSQCAEYAVAFCGICPQDSFETFTTIGCGETICGTIWKQTGLGADFDWYVIEPMGEVTQVTVTVTANFAVGVYAPGLPFEWLTYDTCSASGTFCMFSEPRTLQIQSLVPDQTCDGQQYSLSIECSPAPCTGFGCGDPTSGSCFKTHGPFCDDLACCDAVCAVDASCCVFGWDDDCVQTAWLVCVGEAPANDDCAAAMDVSEGWTGVNTGLATTDGSPIAACGIGPGMIFNDIWFRYTPTRAGLATITTCGSTFPEKVAVYDGCSCGVFGPVLDCKYRPCSPEGAICVPVEAGACYLIRVGGLQPEDMGLADLQITLEPACDEFPACPNPSHDCLTGGSAGCSDETCCELVCEVSSLCCDRPWDSDCIGYAFVLCGYPPCKELSAPPGALIEPEACGDGINQGCGAFHDCSGASGDCCAVHHGVPGCGDSICEEAVCMYYSYCCDASWNETCTTLACSLDEFCDCDAAGDTSQAFTPLACGDTYFGSLSGLLDTDAYMLTLGTSATVKLCVSAEFPGVIEIKPDVCSLETYGWTVFHSCRDGCVERCLEPGAYRVQLFHSYVENACGGLAGNDYVLSVQCLEEACVAPLNDDCPSAAVVGEGVTAFDTFFATYDGPILPSACGGFDGDGGPDVWFLYTATCSGTVTIGACGSSFDSALAVYAGSGCGNWGERLVACNTDGCGGGGEVTFPAAKGETYVIQVKGWPVGEGALTIDCEAGGLAADLDGNGVVDGGDLGLLLAAWGTNGADLNGDGTTDGADLGLLLGMWSR